MWLAYRARGFQRISPMKSFSEQFDYSKEIPKIQEKCEEELENGRTKNVCKRCH